MPVFHLDIESFPAVVERVKNRELAKRPLAIAPRKPRATVLSASPDAKALGVCKDMPVDQVRRRFPGVRLISPDYALYDKAARYIAHLACQYSPIVEPLSYGHVAMDMGGMTRLFGSLESAALALCREIRDRASLPSTVGIAANKLVSAIAAKEVQRAHEPLCLVNQGRESRFLAPLSTRALPEWERPAVRKLLFELNLTRIGQVQDLSRELLGFAMGRLGLALHRHAMGVDPRPVVAVERANSLRESHRFQPDTNDDKALRAALYGLIEKLCVRLRERALGADKARLTLRYSDGVQRERLFAFVHTQHEPVIHQALSDCFTRWLDRRQRVRALTVTLSGLYTHQQQLSLFDPPRAEAVAAHLDAIRERFGATAIGYGRGLSPAAA